jgi:WD40 repeat protein
MDFTEAYPLSVYLSALPFAPVNSVIYHTFHDKHDFPSIAGGYEKSWSPLLTVFSAHDSDSIVASVAFSPDKQHVACGLSGGIIRIWDLAKNPMPVSKLKTRGGDVQALAFSADGRSIIFGSQDGTIGVWDIVSEVELLSPLDTLYGAVGGIAWLSISPDCSMVIAGPLMGGLKVWNLTSGAEVTFLPDSDTARASVAALSFDGSRLLYGSYDGDLIIFGVPSGVKDYVTKPHYSDCPIISIAWSPDNARVISGSRDGTICVQEARSGKSILFVTGSMNDNIVSVAFSADSSRCLSASIRGFMHLWDIASATIVSSFPNEEHNTLCVSLSIDSKQILCGSRDGKIRIWDSGSTENHGEIGSHEGKRRKGHVSTVRKVLFSPNGEYAVSGSEDCTIRIWSVESGEELNPPLRGHWSSVVTMIFFPDGSHLVSGSLDKNIHVWDITSQGAPILVLRGHKDHVLCVDVSPDGSKIISSSRDRSIRIWDGRSGEVLSVITDNGGVPAFSVSFSSDGTRFISDAGSNVRMWDANYFTQLLQASTQHHSTPILSVAFSPNGKRIICSSTSQISVLDAASGQRLSTVENPESFRPITYTMLHDAIGVNRFGFIVDFRTGRTIYRLPPLLPPSSITASASTTHSLMLGTDTGRVFIIHFPPVLFTSPETQTSDSQDNSDMSNHLPVELYYSSHGFISRWYVSSIPICTSRLTTDQQSGQALTDVHPKLMLRHRTSRRRAGCWFIVKIESKIVLVVNTIFFCIYVGFCPFELRQHEPCHLVLINQSRSNHRKHILRDLKLIETYLLRVSIGWTH